MTLELLLVCPAVHVTSTQTPPPRHRHLQYRKQFVYPRPARVLTDPNRLWGPQPARWTASASHFPSLAAFRVAPHRELPTRRQAEPRQKPRLFPADCKSSATATSALPNPTPPAQVSDRFVAMGLRDSTRKLLRRLGGRDKSQEEAQQLQPVALAGASKRSTNRSELCSSFATTVVSHEELEGRRKAASEGSANWEQCGMCTRSFVAGTSRYVGFCSLDCRSASLYSQSARVYRGRYRDA